MSTTDLTGAARQEIADVLMRYATGIDRRDWRLFRTCFVDDCHADYGGIGTWHSVDEIVEFMTLSHASCGHTMHRISNITIEPLDELHATARCYVDALVMGPDNRGGINAIGFYDDELVQTDNGWRIRQRRYTMVHLEPIGEGVTL